jgi:hypothetical protein
MYYMAQKIWAKVSKHKTCIDFGLELENLNIHVKMK